MGQIQAIATFVAQKLDFLIGKESKQLVPRDIILYGFGRIGRLAARILIQHAGAGQQLRLKAIVTRDKATDDLSKRASLLRKDSVHGKFAGVVETDDATGSIIMNGHTVQMITDLIAICYRLYTIRNKRCDCDRQYRCMAR
jgi:glyceraldehyde 3-phosphate dehydrogenase